MPVHKNFPIEGELVDAMTEVLAHTTPGIDADSFRIVVYVYDKNHQPTLVSNQTAEEHVRFMGWVSTEYTRLMQVMQDTSDVTIN